MIGIRPLHREAKCVTFCTSVALSENLRAIDITDYMFSHGDSVMAGLEMMVNYIFQKEPKKVITPT